MSNVNIVVLVGNMTRPPEIKYAPNGTAVTKFGLAVNTKMGEKDEVLFVDVTCFSRQAEVVSEYGEKGRAVLVEGRLIFQSWEGKDGTKRSKHEIIATRVQFLGPKPEQGSRAQAPGPPEEDVPF